MLGHRGGAPAPQYRRSDDDWGTCAGAWLPPPVSDTKHKFYEGFKKPIPGVYNTVIQELLVQQHLMRHNKNYSYDEVSDPTASRFELVLALQLDRQ